MESRLSHKLPINFQTAAKSCSFIFKVTKKLLNFETVEWCCRMVASFFCLFVPEVSFIAVSTRLIRLDFSFSRYFSFFGGSEICSQPFSFLNRINRAFICTFFSAGIWITNRVFRHLEKRVMWHHRHHGRARNTNLSLVIGPFLESTHSHSSINQLNLADLSFES